MELKPLIRSIGTYFAEFDLQKFIKAVQDVCDNSFSILGKHFDILDLIIDLKDGQFQEEITPDRLEDFLRRYNSEARDISISLFNEESVSGGTIRRIPTEYVFISADKIKRKISLTLSLVGEDKIYRIAETFFSHIEYLNIKLPDEHNYLHPFLTKFLLDNPNYEKNIFLIMRYKKEKPLCEIPRIINDVCNKYGLKMLRADDKEYTDDLWDNVLTYLYGCSYGIAVFDQINYREFNPNIAIETGFMFALRKKVLILKDEAIVSLPSDIIGKIYKPFNTYDCRGTIPIQIEKWIKDYQIDK